MRNVAVATIIAKNYLAQARVLADSLRHYHPDLPVWVLLADELDGYFEPQHEPFHVVQLLNLPIPELHRFRFQYERKELAVAAKPFLLRYLLDQGYEGVVYFDPDVLVLSTLDALFEQVLQASIVLTPHLLGPLAAADGATRELSVLQSGVYNGGFLGISATPTTRAFLDWLQGRVFDYCRNDQAQGIYYDQRWLDLVPALFPDVRIVRELGYNIGYWNLSERDISVCQEGVLVDSAPCHFFHFSGYDPDHPQAITRHSLGQRLDDVGPAAGLFRRYGALLAAADYAQCKQWPYAYDRFDNGVPVTYMARQRYRALGVHARQFGDPFQAGESHSYWQWQRRPYRGYGRVMGIRLLRMVYRYLNRLTRGGFGGSSLIRGVRRVVERGL